MFLLQVTAPALRQSSTALENSLKPPLHSFSTQATSFYQPLLHPPRCAKDDWDLVIANIPNCTPAFFIAALEEWKSELILPTACQAKWLITLKPCRSLAT
jgi:hypothetical protein